MTIRFRNTPIFYTTIGTGKPLVLLHGFLESSNIWKDFSSGYEGESQLILIDLPGHGQSDCIGEVHPMEEMAAVVHAVLEKLHIKKASFMGHSMGGYVAMAYTEKYPEKVKNLILVNSTPAADSQERKLNRERAVSLVRKNKKAFVSMAISNLLTSENFEKYRSDLEIMKSEGARFPTKGIIAALEGMKIRTDRTEVLREFPGKKSIFAGEEDPILDFGKIKTVAQVTNSNFYSFPGGHLTFLENKEAFLKTVYFIE